MVDAPTMRERLKQLLEEAWRVLEEHPPKAGGLACQAEHLARCQSNNRAWAESLFIWGIARLYEGDSHQAIPLFSRALAVYRFLGDEEGQWGCLRAIALAWARAGEPQEALETYRQAQAFPRRAEFAAKARWFRWFEGVSGPA
ncbi:MAG: tetratricopeptide repeat protein [Deinococcus-Thermus bacterium]|nr:MAG: tetratricopeptide repeat protein [Deinococcota bacterium]